MEKPQRNRTVLYIALCSMLLVINPRRRTEVYHSHLPLEISYRWGLAFAEGLIGESHQMVAIEQTTCEESSFWMKTQEREEPVQGARTRLVKGELQLKYRRPPATPLRQLRGPSEIYDTTDLPQTELP
ncbi:hypothetical protein ANTRET_LOCUS7371 [Anthophora retusa]